jgi:hypothetical protein
MSVLSPALLGAVGLVLLVAGTAHLRRPAGLRDGLVRHGILPRWARGPVVVAIPALELALGVLLLLVPVGRGPALAPAVAAAVLLAAFSGYLQVVTRRHPAGDLPCACGLGSTPVNSTAVARAALLALFALAGGVADSGWTLTDRPWPEVLVAVSAAGVLALTAVVLPATRVVPDHPELSGVPEGTR